ncbi:hypothetical protein Gohar_007135 [Gossypium harknessii]|uniref:Uncharacterized protein n=1 Tax=Gossypium harknessii TaxID=34285 RepID=A0A7J9GFW2_9ROSI|nr:hypothetical protein [Gossypium harknessii]
MEEVKSAKNAPSTQDPNPPQQPPSKKRSLDNCNDFKNSKFFKMRRLLKDLRPHFIDVLRTPDFRNSKAANEIKENMKLLVELYKQVMAETVPIEKCNNAAVNQPVPSESGMKQNPEEQPQLVKPAISSENNAFRSSSVLDKQQSENGEAPGSYIVGGSAFGWNFITFTGNKSVYYGVTKELFRSAQASLGERWPRSGLPPRKVEGLHKAKILFLQKVLFKPEKQAEAKETSDNQQAKGEEEMEGEERERRGKWGDMEEREKREFGRRPAWRGR